MRVSLLSISLALSWMLSPESLILLGKTVGEHGTITLVVLGIAGVVSAICASVIYSPHLSVQGHSGTLLMGQEVHAVVGLSLTLASRVSVTLLASCAMLVTAGFAFNEIFVYWFPNFAFATLLLVGITGVNIVSRGWAQNLQMVCVAIVILGMVSLLLFGLLAGEGGGSESVWQSSDVPFFGAFAGVFLFVGYDLILSDKKGQGVVSAFIALLLALGIYFFWAITSMKYAPLAQLSGSTIPHLIVAKSIVAPMGRMVMGVVIIAGACAAANALFMTTRETLAHLAEEGLFPEWLGKYRRGVLLLIVLAMSICLMMFTGLAGEEVLEVYLHGSLLLWLLHISVRCYSASRNLSREKGSRVVHGFFVSILLFGAFLYFLFWGQSVQVRVEFCFLTLAAAFCFALFWRVCCQKKSICL